MKAFHHVGIPALLLFLAVFALFAHSINYALSGVDDEDYIESNPVILDGFTGTNLRAIFGSVRQAMYAPLLWISYLLDAELFGASATSPGGFHFTNVLLHTLNAVLLYILFLTFCRKPWRAFFFAALWAMHPLRVESVAWIASRKDLLSGFFGLLSLGAYLRACGYLRPTRAEDTPPLPDPVQPSSLALLPSWCFLALGLLVKPALVPLPAVMLLLDYWPLRRTKATIPSIFQNGPRLLAEKIPFILLAAIASYGASRAHELRFALLDVPLTTRCLAAPIHYTIYLTKFVFPVNLSPLYPDASVSVLQSGLAAGGLLIFTIWAWRARNRHPHVIVGWLFFLGALLPAIGFVRFGIQSLADRFTYFPAIGLSITLLFVWPSGLRIRPSSRAMRAFAAGCILALLAAGSLRLLPAWQSPTSLIFRALSVNPNNRVALAMDAYHRIQTQGDFETAQKSFDQILQSGNYSENEIAGKAQCLSVLAGPATALELLLQSPASENPYELNQRFWNLARYSLMLGRYDDAICQGQQTLANFPADHPSLPAYLHLLIMTAAFEKGDYPLALAHARRFPALAGKTSLEFADLLPYYLHQWNICHRSDALNFFRRLIEKYPDQTGLLNNIAWGLATANWSPAPPAEVIELAQQVCTAFPQANPAALDTLAAAQANAGDFVAAARTIRQALNLLPDSKDSHVVRFRELLCTRLALYEQNLPYREKAFSRWMAVQFGEGLPTTEKNTTRP